MNTVKCIGDEMRKKLANEIAKSKRKILLIIDDSTTLSKNVS
jgi:hypothetical protein